jgi:CheY-like chemotaxis protein
MHRILIVDDEASMLKGIEFHLRENQEYEILTASDKNTAIEQLESDVTGNQGWLNCHENCKRSMV